MKDTVKILVLGDVVGEKTVEKLRHIMPEVKREYSVDFTVVNGENASAGNGLDKFTAEYLMNIGADAITSGNHIWKKPQMQEYICRNQYIIRPGNYPDGTPGKGYTVLESMGVRVLVMNVLGTVYMEPLGSPFEAVERMLRENRGEYDVSLLDVHAEATSEKLAIARYFDGRIGAVYGTHTHVQTSDQKILPGGTGYMSDIGMCGAVDSILGVKSDCVIKKLTTKMPVRFEFAEGITEVCGAVFTIDKRTNKTLSVEAVKKTAE